MKKSVPTAPGFPPDPDEKCHFFDSALVRMAMAWAREKAFEEAAAAARRAYGSFRVEVR